jgi:protein TonB
LSSGEVVEDKTAAASVRLNGPPPQNSPLAGNSQSVQRVRVSQGVSAGLLITKVNPVYPPEARSARISGTVVLRAIINSAGDVETLTLISGHPLLVPAAMDAVKQWKYKPYLLNGKAVTVDTQITVNFALTGG